MILIGVPFEEKFGIEGPMSGYLNDIQSGMVNSLIPLEYKEYFNQVIENDEEIKSVINYFNLLPDLTEEDLKEQAKRQDVFFNEMKSKKK